MTTFVRKSVTKSSVQGTKPSLKNNQVLVSTGVQSADACLGGGIALGTCLLIEEDVYGIYASHFFRHFLAEGVVNQHTVFVSSLDMNPSDIVTELPSVVTEDTTPKQEKETDEELKIAWRYKDMVLDSDKPSSGVGRTFTMSKKMDEAQIQKSEMVFFDGSTSETSNELLRNQFPNAPHYANLLDAITSRLSKTDTVTRIGLHCLGSPLWYQECSENDQLKALARFLFCLRALIRNTQCVCVITIPAYVVEDSSHAWEIEQFCDLVVRIESFAAAIQHPNPLYKDYDGLYHLIKLSSLNTLVPNQPETLQFGFKTKRKRLTVEKLYLPPDLSETASRELGPSCSAATSRNLDF